MKVSWSEFHNTVSLITGGLIFTTIIYAAIFPLLRRYRYTLADSDPQRLSFWLELISYLIIVKATQVVISFLAKGQLKTQNQSLIEHTFASNELGKWFVIIFAALLAPFLEEVIFRWLPFKVIGNPVIAFLLGLITFTLLHSPHGIIEVLIYGIMALFLEINFCRHGFLGSLFLHLLINVTALTVMI